MPYETVQYPTTKGSCPTEVTVSWNKDQAHVQLRVERHHVIECPNGCDRHNRAVEEGAAKMGCTDCPPFGDPIPINSLRVSGDGHVARKDDDGAWNIWRREGMGRTGPEVVVEDQILEWPVAWMPDDQPVAAVIYTEVLTRPQINKMIRTLRKARDDAYGADA